jgi:hypothetical protein
MVDTDETNRPVVTAAVAVRDLFTRLPLPGKDIVWLADELLAIAQHLGSLSLEVVRDGGDNRSLVCGSDSVPPFALPGRGPLYLFRPLLARLAKVGADETGTECNPYGGRYALTRSSRSGPVRLEVEFTNTPASQRLVVTHTPVSTAPRSVPAPDSGTADRAAQPSA